MRVNSGLVHIQTITSTKLISFMGYVDLGVNVIIVLMYCPGEGH